MELILQLNAQPTYIIIVTILIRGRHGNRRPAKIQRIQLRKFESPLQHTRGESPVAQTNHPRNRRDDSPVQVRGHILTIKGA